ncbi:MAG: serine/threonine protein kinase, partial [Planctomycetes bacterium]|nr:serine/threonine protein kinase [Planctomycetota bacterium]
MPAPLNAEAERELEELAEQYLARLEAGEPPDRKVLLRAHPHLGALLDRRLARVELLYRMSHRDAGPAPGDDPPLPAVRAAGPEASLNPHTLPVLVEAEALPPPRFQDYEVLGELGRGGMGVVYKARQKGLDRLVALKVILAGASARVEDRVRFQLEGEVLARLQHPNVVQVYEVGQQDDVPFLVLEYVDGITLEQALAGQPLSPQEAVPLVEMLARFGLAKRIGGDSGATQTGFTVGTPCYMAPEQARGGTGGSGPSADVWALGAILYECLTGRPPFLAPTSLETLRQLIDEDPVPPSRRRAGIPRDLEVICLKCLEKELPRRYRSAAELADDLGRYRDGEPIRARAVGRLERLVKWMRRRPALAALVLVSGLALAGLAGLQLAYSARLRAERDRAEQSLRLGLKAVEELMTEMSEEHLAGEPRMEEYRRLMLSRALDYYRRFLAVHRDDPRLHAETAQAGRRVGDALRLLGRYREAEEAYHAAIDQLGPLARTQDGESQHALALAVCHTDLGEVLRLTDQTVASRRELDRALEIEDDVLAQEPGDATSLQEKARTLYNLGILMRQTGKQQDARRFFGDAVAILETLADRFKDEPRYRQHLARGYLNLGTALRDAKEYEAARTSYQQAVAILTKLIGRWPRVADYRHELAMARNNLGNLLADRNLLQEALAEHEEARVHFANLAKDFPRVPRYDLELANTENSRARALSKKKDLDGARQALTRAREVLEKRVDEPDTPPVWYADLGRTCGNLGVILYLQNQREKARDHFQLAIRHLEKAREKNPANPEYLEPLRENYRNLAESFL